MLDWPLHGLPSPVQVRSLVLQLLPLAVAMLPVNSLVYVLDGVLVGASDFKFLALAMVGAATCTVLLLTGIDAETLQLQVRKLWFALVVKIQGQSW